ncbi:MAG: hypothetical protein ABJA74_01320 [Lapillicoccus sp.]
MSAACAAREVWSQPLPGAAGAMISSRLRASTLALDAAPVLPPVLVPLVELLQAAMAAMAAMATATAAATAVVLTILTMSSV